MLGLTPATGRPSKQLCVPASNLGLQRERMLAQIPFGVQMIESEVVGRFEFFGSWHNGARGLYLQTPN